MLTYTYNDISTKDKMELTLNTKLYLVKSGDGYVLKAICRTGFALLSRCPTTQETTYWSVNSFFERVNADGNMANLFFDPLERCLIEPILNEAEVKNLLGVDLATTQPLFFPKAPENIAVQEMPTRAQSIVRRATANGIPPHVSLWGYLREQIDSTRPAHESTIHTTPSLDDITAIAFELHARLDRSNVGRHQTEAEVLSTRLQHEKIDRMAAGMREIDSAVQNGQIPPRLHEEINRINRLADRLRLLESEIQARQVALCLITVICAYATSNMQEFRSASDRYPRSTELKVTPSNPIVSEWFEISRNCMSGLRENYVERNRGLHPIDNSELSLRREPVTPVFLKPELVTQVFCILVLLARDYTNYHTAMPHEELSEEGRASDRFGSSDYPDDHAPNHQRPSM